MDPASYLSSLASDGASLADAADGHWERRVRGCPEWNMAQLVVHMGGVHAWACKAVAAGGEPVGPRGSASAPEDPVELLGWYRDGLAALVTALSVDPGQPAWTFRAGGGDNVGWWRRRQALETAMHRWDAQDAAGADAQPIAAELAADGVDELLGFLPGILSARPVAALSSTLHLHTTDTPGEWLLDFAAEGLATRREHAKADTAVRGPASGLYLWLWNRQTAEAAGLEVFGRAEVAEAWRHVRI
jgi:uncharacterized protein (TIGR03083 family)